MQWHAMTSGYKQDAKLQERLQRELKRLRQEGSNSQCADCSDTDTRFASTTLGIFLCNRCFGIHRALGAHLTRAKVLTLDAWSEAEVAHLAAVGNSRSNSCYLARLPPDVPPPGPTTSDREVERFAQRKYGERRWYSEAQPNAGASSASQSPAAYVAPGTASTSGTCTTLPAALIPDLLCLEPAGLQAAAGSRTEAPEATAWLADFDPFATTKGPVTVFLPFGFRARF